MVSCASSVRYRPDLKPEASKCDILDQESPLVNIKAHLLDSPTESVLLWSDGNVGLLTGCTGLLTIIECQGRIGDIIHSSPRATLHTIKINHKFTHTHTHTHTHILCLSLSLSTKHTVMPLSLFSFLLSPDDSPCRSARVACLSGSFRITVNP